MPSRARSLALSSHPGPSIAVTLVTVVLAIGAGLEPWRVALLGLAMLFNQLSVGLSNDWIDAGRDARVGRRDKPIARGDIAAGTVRTAAIVSAVLAISLTVPLGFPALLLHLVVLASAWSYNVPLKNSPVSVVPFIVSFGLLPLLVTLSHAERLVAAPWALAAGAMLGIAAHFANVLPDLEQDRQTGVRGLPHRLGRRVSGIVVAVALAAASGLVVLGPGTAPGPLQVAGLVASFAIAALGCALVLLRPPTRLLFQLIILATLIDVVLLATSGGGVVS